MTVQASTEICSFCKSDLNLGASACARCGARMASGWERLGLWRNSFLGLCVIVAIFGGPIAALAISPFVGLIFFLGPIFGYFFIRSRMKRNMKWVAGGRNFV